MAMNLKYLISTVVGLMTLASQSHALDNFKEFRRDTWDVQIAVDYFHSTANYIDFGSSSESLPSGNSYQLIDTHLETRYTPRPTHSFFAWGTLSNSESVDSLSTRRNSALSAVAGGMDFQMYSGFFELVGEVLGVASLDPIDENSDSVFTNEGVFEVRSRLIAQKRFASALGYGWAGFNYRSGGRSFLMPWGVGAQTTFGALLLGVEVFGFQSISEDTDKNNLLRTSYVNSVNAGSMKFYSVDPSLVDSQIYVRAQLSPRWMIQGQGGMTLAGANMADGFHVGGFVRYTFDLTKGYRIDDEAPSVASPVPNQRSNMYQRNDSTHRVNQKSRPFQEDVNDGVDQSLFKSKPTKPPRKKGPTDKEIQQQLDATEFDVELKSKGR